MAVTRRQFMKVSAAGLAASSVGALGFIGAGEGLAAGVRAQTDHEHGQQTILRATEDFAEGVRAVAERRPGNFQGR